MANRSLIAFAAWSSFARAAVMAWHSGMQKNAGIGGDWASQDIQDNRITKVEASGIPDVLSTRQDNRVVGAFNDGVRQMQSPLRSISLFGRS
jgi:hypothetical protein